MPDKLLGCNPTQLDEETVNGLKLHLISSYNYLKGMSERSHVFIIVLKIRMKYDNRIFILF